MQRMHSHKATWQICEHLNTRNGAASVCAAWAAVADALVGRECQKVRARYFMMWRAAYKSTRCSELRLLHRPHAATSTLL